MDFASLKIEVDTDPLGRGYSGMSDSEVTTSLNTVDRQRNRELMSGVEIASAIVESEYVGLTAAQKDRLVGFTNLEGVDPFGFGVVVFKDVFGGGSGTISALAAARVETVSRAAELALPNIKVGWVQEVRK